MGPAPMIRMVEMSVRLGIKSQIWAQKKGARLARPLSSARVGPCARVSLDQIPQLRKAFKGAINRQFRQEIGGWSPPLLFELRRGSLRSLMARLAEAAEQRPPSLFEL